MAQLKDIRTRIASIKNTRQVTSAMKMVSAAKLKKAQDSIWRVSPYEKKLQSIIQNLSLGDISFDSVYFNEPEIESVLIVVVGSNKGLCGAFNSNVAKSVMLHVLENYKPQLKKGLVKFHVIGHQVEKSLKSKGIEFHGSSNHILDDINYEPISKLGNELMEQFAGGTFQRIDIVYNKFKNAANQLLSTEQFLPVIKPVISEKELVVSDYIYEPSKEEILSTIIPESLRMKLYRIILDSNAAEHGARMTSMHMATDNATDLINNLQKEYNNARQSAITNEILEITAGAEALKGF
ncbi:MAG TPA: ATP synthase F1 subunit gamma [Prolixibacteraceae bacterium]|nr:ATP synthase F1 subunit gamma [Prolixibacteraceae bacterium]